MRATIEGPSWLRYRAERDVCVHCNVAVIRFPDTDDKWLHDGGGFRVTWCKGRTTKAEPTDPTEESK